MNEITLITAYFNIGRGTWSGYSRNDEKYLSYFAHWARLRNRLVVYTSPDLVDKVKEIRESFGLGDRTTVIPVPDVSAVQPELYQSIRQTMKNKVSWLFHKKLDHPEAWNYDYNYVANLKPYWVQDAVARGLTTETAAWIDFGYDHGGDDFPYAEDFDFLWQPQLAPLIYLALENPLDDLPIFEVVRSMKVYIRGNLIIAPSGMWLPFWNNAKEALSALSECGLADDDQTMELMVYRRHPEWFLLEQTSYWGELFSLHGGASVRIREHTISPLRKKNKCWKYFLQTKHFQWDIRRRKGREIEQKYFK